MVSFCVTCLQQSRNSQQTSRHSQSIGNHWRVGACCDNYSLLHTYCILYNHQEKARKPCILMHTAQTRSNFSNVSASALSHLCFKGHDSATVYYVQSLLTQYSLQIQGIILVAFCMHIIGRVVRLVAFLIPNTACVSKSTGTGYI